MRRWARSYLAVKTAAMGLRPRNPPARVETNAGTRGVGSPRRRTWWRPQTPLAACFNRQAAPNARATAHTWLTRCASLVAAVGLWAMVGLLARGTAHAQPLHAGLVGGVPAEQSVLAQPPSAIRLLFSEPVQIAGQPITVLAPSGAEVERGAAQVNGRQLSIALDAHELGTYLVLWQVISLDTDPAIGSFIFSVGHPAGRWTGGAGQPAALGPGVVLAAASRWLYYAGYALGFGVLAFRWLIVRSL